MSEGPYYVYILASKRNGTLYIGVTSNLIKRVHQHKNRFFDGFTKKYAVHMLVHYEVFYNIVAAIQREKRLKKWKRQWKMERVLDSCFRRKVNPKWRDLYEDLVGGVEEDCPGFLLSQE